MADYGDWEARAARERRATEKRKQEKLERQAQVFNDLMDFLSENPGGRALLKNMLDLEA